MKFFCTPPPPPPPLLFILTTLFFAIFSSPIFVLSKITKKRNNLCTPSPFFPLNDFLFFLNRGCTYSATLADWKPRYNIRLDPKFYLIPIYESLVRSSHVTLRVTRIWERKKGKPLRKFQNRKKNIYICLLEQSVWNHLMWVNNRFHE